jgi:hypothetical protein
MGLSGRWRSQLRTLAVRAVARRPRCRWSCRGSVGEGRDANTARSRQHLYGAARSRRGCVAATRRRRADEWARCGEKEADRWDPAAAIFCIKIYSWTKIAQNK